MNKALKNIIVIGAFGLLAGCDKDFEEINTNPYAITSIDPSLLFAGAQRTYVMGWETESTIIQHFVNPYNQGATLGHNFNEDIDNFNNGRWDNTYTTSIKNLVQALDIIGTSTTQNNLKSMIRIMKAEVFMGLVDSYSNIPYSEAGKAYLEGKFFPKYDDAATIYADLEKEIRESVAALNPAGDYVSADLFFGKNARIPITSVATQVAQWKKLGNSLLLRLGMRYSKLNPTKASSIAQEAFNGGVMASNADNAMVRYDGTLFTNGVNGNLVNNNPRFYYAAEPFVNQLKNTNDPRSKFLVAAFPNPNNPLDPAATPDYNPANQFGVPVGVLSTAIEAGAPYRGTRGGGLNYSQMNVRCGASLTAPTFWVTYSQTALLLAEAAQRGWIPGGEAAAKNYYESAIRANMDVYALFPNGSAVSDAEKAAYLSQPLVAYNATDALKLINTQYWIACILQSGEAWANFRRSGFPALSPNLFNNNLNGGFVRRLSYPDYEEANNNANYLQAVKDIGGTDNLTTRVFWDKQ